MNATAAWSGPGAEAMGSGVPASRSRVGSPVQIGVGAGLATLYLLALGAGQDQLATVLVLAGAGLSVAWPASGLAMFAVIMPMREPELLAPVRFNAIIAGAIAFGCIVRLPVDRLRLRVHPAAVLLVGYVLFSGLSILPVVGDHPAAWVPSALNALLRFATGVALFLSASYLFRMMSPWPILVLGLVGATLAALLALGDILSVLPLEAITGGLVEGIGGARASGAFADPNFLGLYAATAAVFALGALMVAPRPVKLILLPVVVVLLACVLLSYSRAAYLGLAAGMVVLVARRSLWASLLLVMVLGVVTMVLYPAFLEARQGGPLVPIDTFSMERGEASRAAMANAALAIFFAFPVFGVGFGVFQFVSPSFVVGAAPNTVFSHNQYLTVLAEQGVVGVLMTGTLVVLAAVAILQSRSPLTDAMLAMGAAFMATSVFLHSASLFQSSGLIWLMLAVTLATARPRADPMRGP